MMGEDRGASRTPIRCIGRDGAERTFYWDREDGRQAEGRGFVLRFYETPIGPGDFFEARLVEYGDEELQVVMLSHHSKTVFMARGLPEAALLQAAADTTRTVVSSVNGANTRLLNEHQEPEAEKVWLRLVDRGLAQRRPDGRYALLHAKTTSPCFEGRQLDEDG